MYTYTVGNMLTHGRDFWSKLGGRQPVGCMPAYAVQRIVDCLRPGTGVSSSQKPPI